MMRLTWPHPFFYRALLEVQPVMAVTNNAREERRRQAASRVYGRWQSGGRLATSLRHGAKGKAQTLSHPPLTET